MWQNTENLCHLVDYWIILETSHSLRLEQNDHLFVDILKCISLEKIFVLLYKFHFKVFSHSTFNNKWALVSVMAWHVVSLFTGRPYTSRPRQNGRHFTDDIFKCIFLNENVWISLKISLNLIPKVWIDNIPALVQIMAWRRPGDKPLSEIMVVSLLTYMCPLASIS